MLAALYGSALGASHSCTANAAPANQDAAPPQSDAPVIVVKGQRETAVANIAPIAELDEDAIAAIGATNMGELRRAIQGQTQSADGSDPILLLNAQRVSSYQEINSLPPGAIAKIEILPEPAALRFGFPPTRRVVNFITKRRFSQVETKLAIGSTLPTGSTTENATAGYTRLQGDGRLTANVDYRHSDALHQSERHILPDPDIPFDTIGNITGLGGGEIDPALSALANRIVLVAPVPADPAARGLLPAYAAAANQPRLYLPGHDSTLASGNDTIKGEAVIGGRVGETMGGSLNLSVEHSRDRSLGGPARAALTIPAASSFSPFAGPVVLNRYLTEAAPLLGATDRTTLTAGATLRGAIAGWQWDATASLNQVTNRGVNERGIDLTAVNAAISDGADPFALFDAALLSDRQTDRTLQRSRTIEAKLVATNTPLRLPAGKVSVTGTLEAVRSSTTSSLQGTDPFDLRLGRTRTESALTLDIPLTSRKEQVLPFVGDVSLNASVNLRQVEGFGALHDSTFGIAWTPVEGVQILANLKRSAAAPDMTQQSTPPREIENVAVFDYGTGRTEIATVFVGGNPDLLAMHKRVQSLSINIKPFKTSQLRLSASYEDSTTRDQTGTISAFTPQTEALAPDLFERDAMGRLTSVSYRPINFYSEHERRLQLNLTSSGRVGAPPKPAAGGQAGQQDSRPSYYAGIAPTMVFEDELELSRGAPLLDLLNGDSVGTWKPRLTGYAYGGINHGGSGATFNAWYGGPRHIRNDNPAADLHYLAMFRLAVAAYVPVQILLPHSAWTRQLQLRLEVENLTNSRQRVRDGNGDVPYRFQTDLIEPVGRKATISLRKRF